MIHQNTNSGNRWQKIKGKRFEFIPFCSDGVQFYATHTDLFAKKIQVKREDLAWLSTHPRN